MSGSNYLPYQGSGRPGDRPGSYQDRRFDNSSRSYRGRGGFRGRGNENYRGRGSYRGHDYGHDYRDRDRDPRDRDTSDREQRERDPRERDPRDREPRDREYREEYRHRERDDDLRSERQSRPDRPDRSERAEIAERPERSQRPFRGGFRGDNHGFRDRGSDSPVHKSISSGGITLSGKDHSGVSSSAKFSDPWISILRMGEGKTAARMEATYKELVSINNTISELQSEKYKLSNLLATLDVYCARDSLNVEISKEKLDEFTYL